VPYRASLDGLGYRLRDGLVMDFQAALRKLNDAAYEAFKAARPDTADANDRNTLLQIRQATDRLCDKPRTAQQQEDAA